MKDNLELRVCKKRERERNRRGTENNQPLSSWHHKRYSCLHSRDPITCLSLSFHLFDFLEIDTALERTAMGMKHRRGQIGTRSRKKNTHTRRCRFEQGNRKDVDLIASPTLSLSANKQQICRVNETYFPAPESVGSRACDAVEPGPTSGALL